MNQAQLLSWIRGLLKTGAGALAAHGITQTSMTAQLTQLAGAGITFLVAQLWSHFTHSDTPADAPPSPGQPLNSISGNAVGGRVGAFLLLVSVSSMMLATPGCNTTLAPSGAYSTPDPVTSQALGQFVFDVDKTLVDTKDALTSFLGWELQNRSSLTGSLHSVTVAADEIRLRAPLWYTNAYNLRSNYLWIRVNAPALVPGASNALLSAATQLSSQTATATALKDSH